MLNVVIFGAPGSGKGTQSEYIIKKYNLAHISTGDVLRAEVKAETELGKHANSFMSQGQLIPDELMIDILASVFDQKTKNGDCKGVIFDGFPRTIPQGVALEEMLQKRNQKISAVISLEISDDFIIDRLIKRGRPDDVQDVIQARLDVYKNQTSPLKELYKKQEILHPIKGTGTVDEIFERISEVIDKIK